MTEEQIVTEEDITPKEQEEEKEVLIKPSTTIETKKKDATPECSIFYKYRYGILLIILLLLGLAFYYYYFLDFSSTQIPEIVNKPPSTSYYGETVIKPEVPTTKLQGSI